MTPRNRLTAALWWALWCLWLVFTLQQVADVARYDAPWPVWVLRVLPLVLFVPGVARDSLRAVVWLCFVLLFYFVSAVEAVFARPADILTVLGIVSVVALFIVATFYIRSRGRQLRGVVNSGTDQVTEEK